LLRSAEIQPLFERFVDMPCAYLHLYPSLHPPPPHISLLETASYGQLGSGDLSKRPLATVSLRGIELNQSSDGLSDRALVQLGRLTLTLAVSYHLGNLSCSFGSPLVGDVEVKRL